MSDNTIILRDLDKVAKKEKIAAGTIKPGHLIALDSSGNVVVHPTAGGNAAKMFAFEDPYADTAAGTKAIDTAYASDDSVFLGVCPSGVEVYGLVAAAAAAVVIGDFLESAGDGTVRKHDPALTAEGLQTIGTVAITAAAEKYKTTTTAYFLVNGIQYSKAATDNLTFGTAYTVNTAAAAPLVFGAFLIQMNAAGTVTGKAVSADQVYTSAALALAAMPSPDADQVKLGHIIIGSKASTSWTADTDDMTPASDCETAVFADGALTAVQTAEYRNAIVAQALEAVDNSAGGSEARIKTMVV